MEESSDRDGSVRERRRKLPSFACSATCDLRSLPGYRRKCDLCLEPLKRDPKGRRVIGRAVTLANADKRLNLRYLPELALNLYNRQKSKSFKLVKVCKINRCGGGFYGLTFKAQVDGRRRCPVFRGVVRLTGGKREALFCEIKDDDETITLLPWDDDYVGLEKVFETEDCPPCKDLVNKPYVISFQI